MLYAVLVGVREDGVGQGREVLAVAEIARCSVPRQVEPQVPPAGEQCP